MYNKKSIRIMSWGKDGWKSKAATSEQKKQFSHTKAKMPYYGSAFEPKEDLSSDLNLLQSVQSKIQTGSIHEEIDKLPNNLRCLLQAQDLWHFSNGKIMKVIDSITQARDGEWGADSSEADVDVFGASKSVIRMHLEDTQVLTDDDTIEEYQDMMGELLETANGELLPTAPMVRADTSTTFIGDEDDEYIEQFNEAITVVPVLSNSCQQEIIDIKEDLDKKLADTKDDCEKALLAAQYDQKIDQIAGRELCNKLDSPYCGHKYSQPRRKHKFILPGRTSHLTEAAQEREKFFYTLFSEVSSCTNKDTLFGKIVEETILVNGEPTVKRGRPGGFMGKIRGMYQHDKELAIKWSINNTEDNESAFTKQRKEHIRKLRETGKDEESVRKSTWAWFDREATAIKSKYDEKSGKLISPSKQWKDSIWRQQRTQALKDLFLTKAQWNAIYEMVNIQKARMTLNTTTDKNEQKTQKILSKHYKRIETLSDLNIYRRWAEKRKFIFHQQYKEYKDDKGRTRRRLTGNWNTYKFQKSMLDYLSTTNATRWWKTVIKKQRYLQSRIVLFHKLDNAVESTHKTELPEAFVTCPHPQCEQMAIGQPRFANFKDDKGHLFVQCNCGRKVWLIDQKESGSDIKTQQEATDEYCNTNE